MKHSFKSYRTTVTAAMLGAALASGAGAATKHEIWLLDQSNTYDSDSNGSLDSGGYLYIYQGDDFAGSGVPNPVPEKIDLGGSISANVKNTTGTAPVRPHYISFNPTGTHAVITFVATGH
ncbi:MAG: hypothetical protein EOP85_16040, partial [Verrucomicrobiaceae bacterium]